MSFEKQQILARLIVIVGGEDLQFDQGCVRDLVVGLSGPVVVEFTYGSRPLTDFGSLDDDVADALTTCIT